MLDQLKWWDEDEDAPEIGDRVLYRGRYRDVIGWATDPAGPGREVVDERTPIIVYQNPETERNTYSREEDLEWSDHFGAYYPTGLLLSRFECVVYAAHPETPGGDVPQATQHEMAAQMLENLDLDADVLTDADHRRLQDKIRGYWGGEPRPGTEEVFAKAREMTDHRREEG